MESILKSDIFFFITSIFVVILTTFVVIWGYYLIKILRNLADASKTAKEAIHDAGADLRRVRSIVKASKIVNLFKSKTRKRK